MFPFDDVIIRFVVNRVYDYWDVLCIPRIIKIVQCFAEFCCRLILIHDDVIKWKKKSALLASHLRGEFTGPGEFPAQRPVTRRFDVFFDLRLNKRLGKQS